MALRVPRVPPLQPVSGGCRVGSSDTRGSCAGSVPRLLGILLVSTSSCRLAFARESELTLKLAEKKKHNWRINLVPSNRDTFRSQIRVMDGKAASWGHASCRVKGVRHRARLSCRRPLLRRHLGTVGPRGSGWRGAAETREPRSFSPCLAQPLRILLIWKEQCDSGRTGSCRPHGGASRRRSLPP